MMGRKDFKLPQRVSIGLWEQKGPNFDMDLLAHKEALSKRRTISVPPELISSGRPKISKPWPLSFASVIAITDSISIVQKNLSL
jgi:hypothetical protein